jgi:hypothetical protein
MTLEQYIENDKQAAAQAGEFVLLYYRKGLGTAGDRGQLARFAAHFACRARYWESEQSRLDSIEHTVLTQHRRCAPAGEPTFFGRTERQIQYEEEDRKFFHRKQWEWFNGHTDNVARAA